MKIGIACDHAGYEFKEKLKEYLSSKNNKINDYGCYSLDSVDYPDFAHQLAESIERNENEIGIQFCGTGNGINMTANKHQEINVFQSNRKYLNHHNAKFAFCFFSHENT